MTPFEVLYGHQCRTTLNWIELGEKVIFGTDIIDETEVMVHHIQDNLKVVKSCQESYANKRRQPLEFKIGNHVYLRVLPMKGVYLRDSWRHAWRHSWTSYYLKWQRSRWTRPTPSIQSKSWIKRIMSQGARRSSSSRFNGAIIRNKKQSGKAKTFPILTTWILRYDSEGTCDCSLSLSGPFSFSNLRSSFLLRGEGYDSPTIAIAAIMFL
jgi:hypothetical protein